MTCEDLGPYRKAGRPRTNVCKRGHAKAPGKCRECHKMMDRQRHHANPAPKRAYMVQWRADFRLAFGKHYSFFNSAGLRKADLNRAMAQKERP